MQEFICVQRYVSEEVVVLASCSDNNTKTNLTIVDIGIYSLLITWQEVKDDGWKLYHINILLHIIVYVTVLK